MKIWEFSAASLALALALPALAEEQGQLATSPERTEMSTQREMRLTPVQTEFHVAMQQMHHDMMEGMMDPDPSRAWIKLMKAHHQGAIDMSDIVLKHSKDPSVSKAAQLTKEQNEKDKNKLEALLKNGQ